MAACSFSWVTVLQIVFCSRTHSQLTQFVREAKRTVFGPNLRVVALGSRKSLCINDDVRGLGSVEAMNDKCLEMKDRLRSSASDRVQKAGKKRSRQRMHVLQVSRLPFP